MAIILGGTASANAASSTVHAAGTILFTTDTGGVRVADGTNTWSTLPDGYQLVSKASPSFSGPVTIQNLLHLDSYTNSSPANGDLWNDAGVLKFRTGGVTKTVTLV